MGFIFHSVLSGENIETLITTLINNTDVCPISIGVSTGTGALLAGIPAPFLLEIALAAETEMGVNGVIETFNVSNVSGDTLTLDTRAMGGTTAHTWPVGSKIRLGLSSIHLTELQNALAGVRPMNTVLAGPTSGADAAPTYRALVAADIPVLSSLVGTLPVAKGGTGLTTITPGSVMIGAGTSNVSLVAPGTSGNVLQSNGSTWISAANPGGEINTASNVNADGLGFYKQKTGVNLEFYGLHAVSNKLTLVLDAGNNTLDLDITEANLTLGNLGGTLGPTKGGTGLITYALGDTIYASAANTLSVLAGSVIAQNRFLRQLGTGSVSAAPSWEALVAADIPAHTHAGSDITTGTVIASVGGTGILSYATGDMLYASGVSTLSKLAGNTTTVRQFATSVGTGAASAAPVWSILQGNDIPVFGPAGAGHSKGGVPDPGAGASTGRFLCEDGTWTAPAGGGTVTSVGLTMPAQFAVASSPVTGSGTLGVTWGSQTANYVLVAPDGSAGAPTFRALVAADLPTVTVAKGGTGLTSIASGKMLYASGANTYAALTVGTSLLITAGTIDTVDNTSAQKVIVRKNSGANVGTRHRLNFIEGANITLTVADDGAGDEIDITIDSSGTGVTSVGLALPGEFTVTNSPVTTTGTLTGAWATQTTNKVFAAPSGSTGTPTFRALIAADIPSLDAAKITTGTVAIAQGGTNASTAAGARTSLSAAKSGANSDITSLTGLSTALAEIYGGTGQATYATGDTLYGSAANVLSKLSGNTTVTKKYLSQTGDGVNSAAPAWSVLSAADIGAGVLAVANGGTGLSAIASGKLIYASAPNTYAALTPGSSLAITTGSIDVVANTSNQQLAIRKNSGANVGVRPRINFIDGTNITLTVSDSGGSDEVSVTIAGVSVSGYALKGANTDITSIGGLGFQAKSINYTMLSGDTFCAATGGVSGIAITIPAAAGPGARLIAVKKVDAGAGAVTVTAAGGDTIDGSGTKALASLNSTVVLLSDGTSKWYSISTI